MKVLEILLEAETKPGYYVVGDSHAKAIGAGSPWDSSRAVNGKASFEGNFIADVDSIPKGSVVVISLGANDAAKHPNESADAIAGRIASIVSKSKANGNKTVMVLFPTGPDDNPNKKRRTEVHAAIKSAVSGLAIVHDLDGAPMQADGVHAQLGAYKTLAQHIQAEVQPSGQGAKATDKKDAAATSQFTIDIPSGRYGTAIRDVQQALIALGFDCGPPGADGVRGPYTTAAVKKFQAANDLRVDGDPGIETVGTLNKILASKPEVASKLVKSKPEDIKNKYAKAAEIDPEEVKQFANVGSDELTAKARDAAETYLGRKMSDEEWAWLLRTTAAESGYDTKSYAMTMGTILNHAKTYAPNSKDGVIVAIKRPNAFQAYTGTTTNDNKPSAVWLAGPNASQIKAMNIGAIKYLDKVSPAQMNFSATDPKAYGPGTNIGWRDQQLANKGHSILKGSVFNTTLGA